MILKKPRKIQGCADVTRCFLTPFELDFDLLPLFSDDFSFVCFFADPVTTSNIVGKSLIIVNRRFLHKEFHVVTDQDITSIFALNEHFFSSC